MAGGPFRELPRFLLCPRCGEILERAFHSVFACLRCEGVWLAPVTIEKAFGTPRWPEGQSAWWRSSLNCPECAADGKTQLMSAVMSNDVLVDRCLTHGLWLDRGELGRLMGSDRTDGGDELAALHEALQPGEADLDQLAERRTAWRTDPNVRRETSRQYRTWLELQQQRRDELARAEQERLAATTSEREAESAITDEARARGAELAAAARRIDDERREREQTAAERRALERADADAEAAETRARRAEQERVQTLQYLGDARAQARSQVVRLETQILALRDQLRDAEHDLGLARARLASLEHQFEEVERG